MEGSANNTQRNKVVAGGVLVAIAVVIGVVIISGNGNGRISCSLAASGVGLVADGLTKNKSATVIVAQVAGGAALSEGCTRAINAFVNEPTEAVKLEVQTPEGTAAEKEVTGLELEEQPPEPPGNFQRAIDCIGWDTNFLYELCVDGTLPPPARSF